MWPPRAISSSQVHSPGCAGFCIRSVTNAGCVSALLLFATLRTTAGEVPAKLIEAPVQVAATAAVSAVTAPVPPLSHAEISYEGGLLRIDAHDSTLSDILRKVAALTGAKIDLPPEASPERIPIIQLGPGPARQVIAALLLDSNFDYLIQASDADADKVQKVLLMVREKSTGGSAGADILARSGRRSSSALPARAEEPLPPEPPVPAQAENAGEVNALNSQAVPTPPEPTAPRVPVQADPTQSATAVLDPSGQFPLLQQDPANPNRPGALTPPDTLNQQSISQQLQQMYQQRMQINQQATPQPGR